MTLSISIIIGILAVIAGFLSYGTMASHEFHRKNRGRETITETGHFHWHVFYYNEDDPRVFVPKRTGAGYTVNFANPISIIAALLIVGGLVALTLLRQG